MKSTHRSIRQWWADHSRIKKRLSEQNPQALQPIDNEASVGIVEGLNVIENQPESANIQESNNDNITEDCTQETRPEAISSTEQTEQVVEEQQPSFVEDAPPASPLPPPREKKLDDRSPIWTASLEKFAADENDLYGVIQDRIREIRNLNTDNWDTWLNAELKGSQSVWFRRCKSYLPRLKTVKTLAMSLSNLDPHKIAPCVTGGAFVLVELCFESIEPANRDKAMAMLLKTSIVISKWTSYESDLQRLKGRSRSQKIPEIERNLTILYFDCLRLISSIYNSGKSRGSRFRANVVSEPTLWETKYNEIDDRNSVCSELKSQVESELKRNKKNTQILNWIRPRSEDPELGHQEVRERTGINDSDSKAGKWLLETNEFSLWENKIRPEEKAIEEKMPIFWLNGAMGTGKTTLICRIISHYDDSPIDGVRFIHYYCNGSKATKGSNPPTYSIVLRALCSKLAWNRDGSVAKPAVDYYSKFKKDPNTTPTEETWESLVKETIASSTSAIVFVIDALDECDKPKDYKKLLRLLNKLPRALGNSTLSCLISSRPHVRVTDWCNDSMQIFGTVNPKANLDMAEFIKNQISSKKHDTEWTKSIFFHNEVLLERLESGLLESAGVMFRWVEIWLSIFFPRNKKTVRRREYAERLLSDLENIKSLKELPDDDDDEFLGGEDKILQIAYKKLWDINGGDQYKDLQVRVFRVFMGFPDTLKPHQLLSAVRLDLNNPSNYDNLELDELEGMYCNFLRTDNNGFLQFEHLSAQIFVSSMKEEGSDELVFSMDKNIKGVANIAINIIERPNHSIWLEAGIYLVYWVAELKAKMGLGTHWVAYNAELWMRISPAMLDLDEHFGWHIFRTFDVICRRCTDEKSVRRINQLFLSMGPGLEGWILCRSLTEIQYPSEIIGSTGPDGEDFYFIPLLTMLSYGISPFYHEAESQIVLPEFEDITSRALGGTTALHVACKKGTLTIIEDLLKFDRMKRTKKDLLLFAENESHEIPIYYSANDTVFQTLLRHEAQLDDLSFPPPAFHERESTLLSWRDNEGNTPLETRHSLDRWYMTHIWARLRYRLPAL